MSRKLYVGNLAYSVTDRDLEELFGAHGTVLSAAVAKDRDAGLSMGFGFVEMMTDQDVRAALAALPGKKVHGRALAVNLSRPKEGGGKDRRKAPGGGRVREARKRPPALGSRLRRPPPRPAGSSPNRGVG